MAETHAPLVAFFDIDGTLIDSDPETYAAAQAPGATDEDRARAFLPTEEVCHSVDPAPMERVVDIFTQCGAAVMLEGTEGSVIWMPPGEHPAIDLSLPVIRDRGEISRLIPELSVVKAFWMAEEHPKLAPREEELRSTFTVSDLGVGGYELSPAEVSKATGMADVLAAVGGHGTVYGFGDSENDIPMLEAVDVAVVMANGVPTVLELADVVAPPVSEDGVAQVLEEILAGEVQGS